MVAWIVKNGNDCLRKGNNVVKYFESYFLSGERQTNCARLVKVCIVVVVALLADQKRRNILKDNYYHYYYWLINFTVFKFIHSFFSPVLRYSVSHCYRGCTGSCLSRTKKPVERIPYHTDLGLGFRSHFLVLVPFCLRNSYTVQPL